MVRVEEITHVRRQSAGGPQRNPTEDEKSLSMTHATGDKTPWSPRAPQFGRLYPASDRLALLLRLNRRRDGTVILPPFFSTLRSLPQVFPRLQVILLFLLSSAGVITLAVLWERSAEWVPGGSWVQPANAVSKELRMFLCKIPKLNWKVVGCFAYLFAVSLSCLFLQCFSDNIRNSPMPLL